MRMERQPVGKEPCEVTISILIANLSEKIGYTIVPVEWDYNLPSRKPQGQTARIFPMLVQQQHHLTKIREISFEA